VVLEDSYKIYFVIFGHSYKFLQIFEVLNYFWNLKQLKNDLKSPHSVGPKPARGYSARPGGLPCTGG
jgi:hypothetical protein